MKFIKLHFTGLSFIICISIFGQVNVDHPIVLTGSGTNARLEGMGRVQSYSDAASVDYIQKDSLTFGPDGGSANAYSVTLSPAPSYTSYPTGMAVSFKAANSNTGASTLSVNNHGTANILKNYNVTLAANDIQAGQLVTVMFDGTNFQMLSPSGNAATVVPHGKQMYTYTGSSQNFTVPSGVTTVWVSMSGGGGGGGYTNGSYGGGGGGGGGAVMDTALTVTPLQVYSVTVGGFGAGGISSSTTGGTGGPSSFGSLLTKNGGGGGGPGLNNTGNIGGTAGGVGGVPGSAGASGSPYGSGAGGSSIFGVGGTGCPMCGDANCNANTAAGYGAGGSGTCGNGNSGTAGFVLVEW